MEYKRKCPFDELIISLKELYRYIVIYTSKYYNRYNNIFFRKKINKLEYLSNDILEKCDEIQGLKRYCQCNTNFIFINKYLVYFREWILDINDIFLRKVKNIKYMIGKKYEKKRKFYMRIISLIVEIINKTNICRNKVIKKNFILKNVINNLNVKNYIYESNSLRNIFENKK